LDDDGTRRGAEDGRVRVIDDTLVVLADDHPSDDSRSPDFVADRIAIHQRMLPGLALPTTPPFFARCTGICAVQRAKNARIAPTGARNT
jgi:hypothetical protein